MQWEEIIGTALAGLLALVCYYNFLPWLYYDFLPWIARKIAIFAASLLPPGLSERLREEWLSDLQSHAGNFAKLRYALGLIIASGRIFLDHLHESDGTWVWIPTKAGTILLVRRVSFGLCWWLFFALLWNLLVVLASSERVGTSVPSQIATEPSVTGGPPVILPPASPSSPSDSAIYNINITAPRPGAAGEVTAHARVPETPLSPPQLPPVLRLENSVQGTLDWSSLSISPLTETAEVDSGQVSTTTWNVAQSDDALFGYSGGGGIARITPSFNLSNLRLPVGQVAELQMCVTNGSQGSTRTLQALDTFTATFDNACGVVGFEAAVTTDSAVFDPSNFTVDAGAVPGQIRITYTGPATPFPLGDSFCGQVVLQTPNAIGSCRATYAGPANNNYNAAVSPPLNILSILDSGATGVPPGAIVLSRNACPAGYTRLEEYAGLILVGSTIVGQTGGQDTHTHAANGLTIPGQSVNLTTQGAATDRRWVDDNSGGDDHFVSGENHQHQGQLALGPVNVAGSTALAPNRPPFSTILICEKQ